MKSDYISTANNPFQNPSSKLSGLPLESLALKGGFVVCDQAECWKARSSCKRQLTLFSFSCKFLHPLLVFLHQTHQPASHSRNSMVVVQQSHSEGKTTALIAT